MKVTLYAHGKWTAMDLRDLPADAELVGNYADVGHVYMHKMEYFAKTPQGRRIEAEQNARRWKEQFQRLIQTSQAAAQKRIMLQRLMDVLRAQLARRISAKGRETARKNRHDNKTPERESIIGAEARFKAAFAKDDKRDLAALLVEFGVPEKRRRNFKLNNIALAIADSGKYSVTTATQVRNILRTKTR